MKAGGIGQDQPRAQPPCPGQRLFPSPGQPLPPPRDYLAGPGEGLGHLAVPAPVAGGDEVGHAAALQERGRGHPAFAEDPGEGDHLHEPQADDGGLRVVAAEEAVTEPSAHGHDVLGRRREAWRCGPSHAHRGKVCGGGGRSTGGEAGRLLRPAGPRVPLWSSEREGSRDQLPLMGQTAQRTLQPGLRGKHPPEKGHGAEASPLKCCLYRLPFFFFLNKSKALSNYNTDRKVVNS